MKSFDLNMKCLLALCLSLVCCQVSKPIAPEAGEPVETSSPPNVRPATIIAPTEDAVKEFGLDPFYKKYVSAKGFPVISSEKVMDHALLEAVYLIDRMLEGRDDIRKAMIENKVRFVVMAHTELTTDVPEHSDLEPNRFWDRRARGLGATRVRPAVSCGEENLLRFPGDHYHRENILIHEFAHAMHEMGLNSIDEEFDRNLEQQYQKAMEKGLWKGKYAATNRCEYWAEGVQSWFDTNRENDNDHNHVDTREELKEYDPGLAAIIEQVYGDGEWRYKRPSERKEPGHLDGYDRNKAPRFEWPPGLQKWYDNYTAKELKKK